MDGSRLDKIKSRKDGDQKWQNYMARAMNRHVIPSKKLSCLRAIDLNGYRRSRYWLGCYRNRKDFSMRIMRKSIQLFMEEFCQEFDSCYMISSLVYADCFQVAESDEILEYANRAEQRLEKYGVIGRVREDDDFDIHELTEFSLIKNVNKSIVRDIAVTAMMNPRTFGHVFFIFESLNLVVYVHDETGFGFIGIDDCSVSSRVRDFLVKVNDATFESLLP